MKIKTPLCMLLSAILFAGSSMYPDSLWGPFACVASFAILVFFADAKAPHRHFFLWGVAMHLCTFYWLAQTMERFGGFPRPAAYALFLLYSIASSMQFIVFSLLVRRLSFLEKAALAVPIAWLIPELILPKLFPWTPIHPLIDWQYFSSLAEFVGESFLTAVFLWWITLAVRAANQRSTKLAVSVAAMCVISLGIGYQRNNTILAEMEKVPPIPIALVQGNLGLEEKGDVAFLEPNIETYRRLSQHVEEKKPALIVWPESVVNRWTPEGERSFAGTRLDPYPEKRSAILYGTLSYRERSAAEHLELESIFKNYLSREELTGLRYRHFNAAFALSASGEVLGSYAKRILMPFGEYLPFERQFPILRAVSPYSGSFDPGDRTVPIEIPVDALSGTLKVMPLICYEDLVSSLAVDAARSGAQVLINLTNDAWYGPSFAPYQHHLLARWKAIESRRYLLRSTNTGLTAAVDPLGRTVGELPIFDEGVLLAEVRPLSIRPMLILPKALLP